MSARCPRRLKSAPTKLCPLAQSKTHNKNGEPTCEWYIDNEEAKNCFWYYLFLHRGEQHSVTAIARLWCSSVNNVSISEKSAHVKIIKHVNDHKNK